MYDNKKERYFNSFSLLIKNIKSGLDVKNLDLDSFYNDIINFDDLSYQDIITYMLHCFKVIELTEKWKLKKQIHYELFLNNMENIYTEIFCSEDNNLNKIVCTISFGTIIEKTITYNVSNNIVPILDGYLKCIGKKRNYLKDNDLILLRGNLCCQIYNVLKDNEEIAEIYSIYLDKVSNIFKYNDYVNNAKLYYSTLLEKDDLSYININNYLSYKTYNKFEITSAELEKVMKILIQKFNKNYFDKNVYLYVLKTFTRYLLEYKKINNEIEVVFNDNIINGKICLNYNRIDSNIRNNLDVIRNIYYQVNKIDLVNNNDDYIELLKLKDNYILERQDENNSLFNYDNFVRLKSIIECNSFYKNIDNNYYYEKFNKLLSTLENEYNLLNVDRKYEEFKLSNTEYFINNYNNDEIKEIIKKNKILKLEFKNDGMLKTIADLINEKISIVNSLKNKDNYEKDKLNKKLKIYDNLIKYHSGDLYSILNDYYSLLLLDTVDSSIIKEKENVLKNVLPNILKQKILLCGNMSREQIDEIYTDYINPCIKKITQNRVNNKKFDSTKDFLNYEKSNSDNYFGLCKLQEILENIKTNKNID